MWTSAPHFRLQGGETFLVRDLPKIVDYACSKKQIQHLQIVTNGTILPSPELLRAMKNPKVLLSVSDYSCNEDLVPRFRGAEIIRLCCEAGVNAKHWLIKAGDVWFARQTLTAGRIQDAALAEKNAQACYCMRNLLSTTIYARGKLYPCPQAFYFERHNSSFVLSEDDTIDLLHPSPKMQQKVNDFINRGYSWYPVCANCNAAATTCITSKPGVQLEPGEGIETNCSDP